MRVVDGVVEYIQMVGGNASNIAVLHTSSNTANGVYYFDCALNRGNTSSGASVIEDVAWHVNAKQTNFTAQFSGEATTDITNEHKANLKTVAGINIEPGTKYSDVYYTRAKVVVLIEMSWAPARLNEPGCERRSSKYSSTSHCYHSLNLLLQTPRPRRNPNPGLFIFKLSNYWVFHVSVFKVVFQPERRVPHIGECLLSFSTCHLVWSSILCNM